jgi:hypothetical protein
MVTSTGSAVPKPETGGRNRGTDGKQPDPTVFLMKSDLMTRFSYLASAALLVLAAPQIAETQGNRLAEPSLPVSTVRGSDKAPITVLVFSDFESFPCARSASVIDGFLQQTETRGQTGRNLIASRVQRRTPVAREKGLLLADGRPSRASSGGAA